MIRPSATARGLARLRGFVEESASRCDLCSQPLAEPHGHLLDLPSSVVKCACEPCALRFEDDAGKLRRIPRRVRDLPGLELSQADWDELDIPIELAFFVREDDAEGGVTVVYPSPAGTTQGRVRPEVWQSIASRAPLLAEMRPHVEALVVSRLSARARCLVVPIDECYRLVGLVRKHWRGLRGGERLRAEIDGFFEVLSRRAGSRR